MTIPDWLSSQITEADLTRIREAVQKAESLTSAEIVPMIVRRSSHVGHVPMQIFLFLSLVGLALAPLMKMPWSLASVDILIIVAAFVGAHYLARLEGLQRLFTRPADLEHQVFLRAQLEFYSSNIKATRQHTGVLIFLSLLEKRAVVLADVAVAEKLPQEAWQGIIHSLLHPIRQDDFASGMVKAIEECGALLQRNFPASSHDHNELGNDLIMKA